jgi:hypothetical protein
MTEAEYYGVHGGGSAADLPGERLALVDPLDRVLAGGVVISGDITLSIADVDLVVISLRALLTSVSALVDGAGAGKLATQRAWEV